MHYCINYYGKKIDLLQTIEEININLSHITNLKRDLKEFCELHKKQRINLIIPSYKEAIEKEWMPYIFDFQQENKENYNIYIVIPNKDEEYYPALKEKYTNMKFYFQQYVKDWDTLQGFINEGVSDIYVIEEFCFSMKDIAAAAHSKNVRVRVFPNVAQSSWRATPALKKFWIRPEDLHYYEDYVDTIEFYGDYDKQIFYYEIYHNDKKWFGELDYLIIDLNKKIDNTCIIPRFGERRTYCNHKCQKNQPCQICDIIFDLSINLNKSNIKVIIDKNKEEKNG